MKFIVKERCNIRTVLGNLSLNKGTIFTVELTDEDNNVVCISIDYKKNIPVMIDCNMLLSSGFEQIDEKTIKRRKYPFAVFDADSHEIISNGYVPKELAKRIAEKYVQENTLNTCYIV